MRTLILLFVIILLRYSANGQTTEIFRGAAGIEFIRVPEGKYIYGKFTPTYPTPDSHEHEYRGYSKQDYENAKLLAQAAARPGFQITIPRSFYIARFETTQTQWNSVMQTQASFFKGDSLPVESVSFEDATRFVEKLNMLDTLHHYRLPSEFEWEYAARAGREDDISWDDIRKQAQLGKRETQPVGKKTPNAWGLYDMLGNVWEWTTTFYNEKIFADSAGNIGNKRVLKGASFVGDVKNATYMTHAAGPGNKWDVGFRVVMENRGNDKPAENITIPKTSKLSENFPGWHLSRTSHQGATPLVTFEKGVLTLQQNPYGQGGVLLTNRKYRDVEISLDVKIDSFCNGGIFLRSTESGQAYQIELAEPGGTGNLLGEMLQVSTPADAVAKREVWKASDWNHFKIRMTGAVPTITLWINGRLMWTVTQPKNDFIAAATEGMSGLQVHWSATYSANSGAFDMSSSWRPNGKHQFKNIRIRALR